MYVLLTGTHPLYVRGEKIEKYVSKLSNPKWVFPAGFSHLAKSLFLKLVRVNPMERYAAKDALLHPWITREICNIPLSFADTVIFEQSKEKMRNVFFICYSYIKIGIISYIFHIFNDIFRKS